MSTKSPSENKKRLIIALTGASGAIYGIRALQALQAADDIETHLVISPSAQYIIAEETDMAVDDIKALADQVHSFKDIGASLTSSVSECTTTWTAADELPPKCSSASSRT